MRGALWSCLAILFTILTMFFARLTNLSAILTKPLENSIKTIKKRYFTSGMQYLFFTIPANFLQNKIIQGSDGK